GSNIRLLHCLQTAEVFEQPAGGALAYSGNLAEFSGAVAHLAAFAVEGHGEAVSFIADELYQVQNGRMVIEGDRVIFLAADIDDFFALGNCGYRLVDDFK